MPRELWRLTEKLANKPHLITGSALDSIFTVLFERDAGVFNLKVDPIKRSVSRDDVLFNEDTRVGIIQIDGPLTYLHYDGLCGESGPSYETIKAQADTLARMGAKVIVLDQDSPGGEAYMAFETARYIRKLADENDIKIISYVDGHSASASYVFSSVAHEIIVNPQAEVGSVGVVVKLVNINRAKKSMGVDETYVYAGESKIPYTQDGEWDKAFLQEIQEKVDKLYVQFVSHVSEYRGIDASLIKEKGAKMFTSDDAVSLGFADKVMTHEEFANYLATIAENKFTMPIIKKSGKQLEYAEMEERLSALEQEKEGLEKSLQEAIQSAQLIQEQSDATIAQLQSEIESLKEELNVIADKEAQAKAQKRKEALVAATDVERAETLYASLESLSDEDFETVIQGFTQSKEALEKTELFKEVGSELGDTTVPEKPKTNKTLEIVKSQYSK